jgi:hypothetical protein
MAQEFRPGQIVPQSGIYTVTHDPAHADTPHEVTVIKGRRFPTCRHCKGIRFELAHAARHVGEIDHLSRAAALPQWIPPQLTLLEGGGFEPSVPLWRIGAWACFGRATGSSGGPFAVRT